MARLRGPQGRVPCLRPTAACLLILALLAPALPAVGAVDEPVTLTFTQPQTAGICGFRPYWDVPVVCAEDGAVDDFDRGPHGKASNAVWDPQHRLRADGKPGALVFDAVHRSLLIRFPGAAMQTAARMGQGYVVQKAELVLPFKSTELWPQGYLEPPWTAIGTRWVTNTPRWHAIAWALRRPWLADPTLGPTFNAHLNGAAYWARYGAQDTQKDRFPRQFGPAEVSATHPDGRLDVTPLLTDPAFGTPVERLRRLEWCGFLVRKWETYDVALWYGQYEYHTARGPQGVLIKTPQLVVTLAPGKAERIPIKDLALDLPALAKTLKERGGEGKPTAVLPSADEIKRLAARLGFVRPAGMPDWQWTRLQELQRLGGGWNFPATPEAYHKWIDDQLACAPRRWGGFGDADRVQLYYRNLDALPAPVREHWQRYWEAWLMPDRDIAELGKWPDGGKEWRGWYNKHRDWRGNFTLYRHYCYAMGTMNFNHFAALGTLMGGAMLGSERLMADGRHGLEKWPLRTWSWYDGSSQESIDHYYFAHSLKDQKCFADFGPTHLDRMMGQSVLTKSIEELASAFHPALRRFVSSSTRTAIGCLLGTQDGLQAVMHLLSPSGAYTDLGQDMVTATNVEAMPVVGRHLRPALAAQQTLNGPWAPVWLAPVVEDKPLPYERTVAFKNTGTFNATPLWRRSYLGRHYGLASQDVSILNETVPLMAQWRREPRPAASMTDLGTLIVRPGINRTEMLDSLYHDTTTRNPNGCVGTQGSTMATLQHRNKLLTFCSPLPKLDYSGGVFGRGDGRPVPADVKSVQMTIGLLNFQATPAWEIYVDGQRVTQFPCTARFGQRITIRDGVSYLGIIAIPATDLGRDAEVVIADEGRMTEMQEGGKAREALRINTYLMKRETPLDKAVADWEQIDLAYGGYVVELGDETEYKGFAAFQQHMAATKLQTRWDAATKTLVATYVSGSDTLACTYRPGYGGNWNRQPPTDQCFPDRRVNGQWPYLPAGIDSDTTLTQQGSTGRLTKNGATLLAEPGRMSYLLADPRSGTYVGLNPLPDPTFWRLELPDGVAVAADGRLGLTRVVVRPGENRLWVDHAAREDQKGRPDMASALLVSGLPPNPAVELNGAQATAKWEQVMLDGKPAWVVPLAGRALPVPALIERYTRARQAFHSFAQGGVDPASSLIQDWQIVGPFPLGEDAAGFETPFAPEADYVGGKLDLKATYEGLNGDPVTWRAILPAGKPAFGPGQIDLARLIQPNQHVVAYAFTRLTSERERAATLLTGSNDTITVWVNGKPVLKKLVWRVARMDEDRVPITLRQGENTVLVKVCQREGGWGFFLRIGDEFGIPILR